MAVVYYTPGSRPGEGLSADAVAASRDSINPEPLVAGSRISSIGEIPALNTSSIEEEINNPASNINNAIKNIIENIFHNINRVHTLEQSIFNNPTALNKIVNDQVTNLLTEINWTLNGVTCFPFKIISQTDDYTYTARKQVASGARTWSNSTVDTTVYTIYSSNETDYPDDSVVLANNDGTEQNPIFHIYGALPEIKKPVNPKGLHPSTFTLETIDSTNEFTWEFSKWLEHNQTSHPEYFDGSNNEYDGYVIWETSRVVYHPMNSTEATAGTGDKVWYALYWEVTKGPDGTEWKREMKRATVATPGAC